MQNMKKIKINQELNTFEDADTQSGIIGKINHYALQMHSFVNE